MGDLLGIDVGSTRCAMAVRHGDGPATVVPAGIVTATLGFAADGSAVVGDAAERLAETDPARVLRDIVRRVGDPTPLLVGDRMLAGEDAVALLVAGAVEAVSGRFGTEPSGIALAHPVGWDHDGLARVLTALGAHGLRDVAAVPAPVAAVAARGGSRGRVVVVDLGTDVTVSVLQVPDLGPAALLGRPVEVTHLAGEAFDDLVLAHVKAALGPTWSRLDPRDPGARHAVAQLRRRCRQAKERLSTAPVAQVDVELPGVRARVAIDRARFEEMAAPAMAELVTALDEAFESSATDPAELDDIVLTGGSAQVPLVAATLCRALGRPVAATPAPLAALGAAVLGGATGRRRHAVAHPAPPATGPRHARTGPPRSAGTAASEAPRHAVPRMRAPEPAAPRVPAPRRPRPGPSGAVAAV